MATEGNAGSFRIEVEDGTAAGSEKVLKSLAAMQAKADKALTPKSGGKGSKAAEAYRKEWEAEEKKRIETVQKAAEKERTIREATAKKMAESIRAGSMPLAQSNSAVDLAIRGAGGLAGAWSKAAAVAPQLAIAIGSITAGLALLDQAATTSLANQKISANLQIDISGAREAFQGYVSDVDLAKAANRAFAMGVVENGDEFAELSKGVKQIAENLGEDYLPMLDSAVVALGRQSALVLDNLGIILDQEKAQKIYAKALDKSTSQLTELEKQQAFTKAGMILIAEEADKAAGRVDGLGASYAKTAIAMENFKNSALSFDDSLAVTREKIRKLSDEDLAHLTFADALSEGSPAALAYKDTLDSVGLSMRELRKLSNETGKSIRELAEAEQVSRAQEAEDTANKAAEAYATRQAEVSEKQAASLEKKATLLENQAEILGTQRNKEAEILGLQHAALELRRQAALLQGSEIGAIEQEHEKQMLLIADQKKQAENAAARLKAELDGQDQIRSNIIRIAELRSELAGREQKEGATLAAMRLDAKRAELDNELRILRSTVSKSGAESVAKRKREEQIAQEFIIVGLEHEIESRKAANELIQKAIDKSRALALAEQDRQAWAIAGEQKLLAANAAQIQQRTNFELALAKTPQERVVIQARLESNLHRTRLAQIEEERKAQEAAFARRELELDPKDGLAKEQLAHDRKMAFMDLEMQKSAELDAQATRLAQAEAERRRKAIADFQEVSGAIESITGQVSGIVTTEIGRTRGIEDEAHSAKIQRMEQAAQATSASLDREINAAKGNAAQMAALRAKKAKLEEANRKAIEKAEAKHQEKRKRQEMRGAGIQLLIQGAIETGKAIAAYASYNFVQGALHTAAAALNIGYGAALMSGRIPVGGGGGSGGGGGGDSFGSGVGSDTGRDTSGAAKTPESTPGEAANRASSKARPTNEISKQSGGVVFNGNVTINATGKVDKESAEAFGFGALKNVHSREALA